MSTKIETSIVPCSFIILLNCQLTISYVQPTLVFFAFSDILCISLLAFSLFSGFTCFSLLALFDKLCFSLLMFSLILCFTLLAFSLLSCFTFLSLFFFPCFFFFFLFFNGNPFISDWYIDAQVIGQRGSKD